jgi:hypothetical protein
MDVNPDRSASNVTGRFALPARPEFIPEDIRGNLAEARQLRCIGTGQPIKASWLCLECLDLYVRHRLPADLDLVDLLRVLTLCYTDAIKRGEASYQAAAGHVIQELDALGGVAGTEEIHRRCREGDPRDPMESLKGFRIRVDGEYEAEPRSPRLQIPLVRFPGGALPLRPDARNTVDATTIAGAEVRVEAPVRLQARFEALYLRGVVGMSQALRVERSSKPSTPGLLQLELPYLVDSAWWFHLASLVASAVPAGPEECFRKARAKSSMLIRRIEAGKHFEMPTLDLVDLLE